MTNKTDWKHGVFIGTDKEPDAIAVFDDEDAADGDNCCDSIYKKYGDKFSPCRTVFRDNREHWTNVLLAWATHAPLLDMRNNREIPLP